MRCCDVTRIHNVNLEEIKHYKYMHSRHSEIRLKIALAYILTVEVTKIFFARRGASFGTKKKPLNSQFCYSPDCALGTLFKDCVSSSVK
jgi:hypothetical protein